MVGRTFVVLALLVAVAGCAALQPKTVGKAADTSATLAVTCNVRAADVYIDGALFGQIARAGKAQNFVVAGGKHDLLVKKFGYEDFSAAIGVEAGGINTLAVDLKRLPTKIVDVSGETGSEKAADAQAARDAKVQPDK